MKAVKSKPTNAPIFKNEDEQKLAEVYVNLKRQFKKYDLNKDKLKPNIEKLISLSIKLKRPIKLDSLTEGLKTETFNDFADRFNHTLEQGRREGLFDDVEIEQKQNDEQEKNESIKIIQEVLASFNQLALEYAKKSNELINIFENKEVNYIKVMSQCNSLSEQTNAALKKVNIMVPVSVKLKNKIDLRRSLASMQDAQMKVIAALQTHTEKYLGEKNEEKAIHYCLIRLLRNSQNILIHLVKYDYHNQDDNKLILIHFDKEVTSAIALNKKEHLIDLKNFYEKNQTTYSLAARTCRCEASLQTIVQKLQAEIDLISQRQASKQQNSHKEPVNIPAITTLQEQTEIKDSNLPKAYAGALTNIREWTQLVRDNGLEHSDSKQYLKLIDESYRILSMNLMNGLYRIHTQTKIPQVISDDYLNTMQDLANEFVKLGDSILSFPELLEVFKANMVIMSTLFDILNAEIIRAKHSGKSAIASRLHQQTLVSWEKYFHCISQLIDNKVLPLERFEHFSLITNTLNKSLNEYLVPSDYSKIHAQFFILWQKIAKFSHMQLQNGHDDYVAVCLEIKFKIMILNLRICRSTHNSPLAETITPTLLCDFTELGFSQEEDITLDKIKEHFKSTDALHREKTYEYACYYTLLQQDEKNFLDVSSEYLKLLMGVFDFYRDSNLPIRANFYLKQALHFYQVLVDMNVMSLPIQSTLFSFLVQRKCQNYSEELPFTLINIPARFTLAKKYYAALKSFFNKENAGDDAIAQLTNIVQELKDPKWYDSADNQLQLKLLKQSHPTLQSIYSYVTSIRQGRTSAQVYDDVRKFIQLLELWIAINDASYEENIAKFLTNTINSAATIFLNQTGITKEQFDSSTSKLLFKNFINALVKNYIDAHERGQNLVPLVALCSWVKNFFKEVETDDTFEFIVTLTFNKLYHHFANKQTYSIQNSNDRLYFASFLLEMSQVRKFKKNHDLYVKTLTLLFQELKENKGLSQQDKQTLLTHMARYGNQLKNIKAENLLQEENKKALPILLELLPILNSYSEALVQISTLLNGAKNKKDLHLSELSRLTQEFESISHHLVKVNIAKKTQQDRANRASIAAEVYPLYSLEMKALHDLYQAKLALISTMPNSKEKHKELTQIIHHLKDEDSTFDFIGLFKKKYCKVLLFTAYTQRSKLTNNWQEKFRDINHAMMNLQSSDILSNDLATFIKPYFPMLINALSSLSKDIEPAIKDEHKEDLFAVFKETCKRAQLFFTQVINAPIYDLQARKDEFEQKMAAIEAIVSSSSLILAKAQKEEEEKWQVSSKPYPLPLRSSFRKPDAIKKSVSFKKDVDDARLKAEEEARLNAKEEARLKAEEQARLNAEEEAWLKAEEEARLKAEEDKKRKAEIDTTKAKKEVNYRILKRGEDLPSAVSLRQSSAQSSLLSKDSPLEAAPRRGRTNANIVRDTNQSSSLQPATRQYQILKRGSNLPSHDASAQTSSKEQVKAAPIREQAPNRAEVPGVQRNTREITASPPIQTQQIETTKYIPTTIQVYFPTNYDTNLDSLTDPNTGYYLTSVQSLDKERRILLDQENTLAFNASHLQFMQRQILQSIELEKSQGNALVERVTMQGDNLPSRLPIESMSPQAISATKQSELNFFRNQIGAVNHKLIRLLDEQEKIAESLQQLTTHKSDLAARRNTLEGLSGIPQVPSPSVPKLIGRCVYGPTAQGSPVTFFNQKNVTDQEQLEQRTNHHLLSIV